MVALAQAQHPQSAIVQTEEGTQLMHGHPGGPCPSLWSCKGFRALEQFSTPLPRWHKAPRPVSSPCPKQAQRPGSAGTGKSFRDNEQAQAPHQGLECAGTWRQHTWVTYIALLMEYLPGPSNGLAMKNLHVMKPLPPARLASALRGVDGGRQRLSRENRSYTPALRGSPASQMLSQLPKPGAHSPGQGTGILLCLSPIPSQ